MDVCSHPRSSHHVEEAQPSGAFCARLIFSAQLLAVLRVSCFRGSPGVKGICWAALRIIHLANMPGAPLRPRTGLDALGQAPDPQSPAPIEDITATNNCRQGDSSCFFRHTSEQEPKSSSLCRVSSMLPLPSSKPLSWAAHWNCSETFKKNPHAEAQKFWFL